MHLILWFHEIKIKLYFTLIYLYDISLLLRTNVITLEHWRRRPYNEYILMNVKSILKQFFKSIYQNVFQILRIWSQRHRCIADNFQSNHLVILFVWFWLGAVRKVCLLLRFFFEFLTLSSSRKMSISDDQIHYWSRTRFRQLPSTIWFPEPNLS